MLVSPVSRLFCPPHPQQVHADAWTPGGGASRVCVYRGTLDPFPIDVHIRAARVSAFSRGAVGQPPALRY